MNRVLRLCGLCVLGAVAGTYVAAAEPAQVYRCGNEYTNQPDPKRACAPLRSAAITVIEGTKVQPSPTVATSPGVVASESKVDIGEQRQRDAQARAVLQTEWQRAQVRHQALLQEWNQGEPERRADELRQPPKYQERVTQLRTAVQRSEADLAGLQRELSRLSASTAGGNP